MLIRDKFGYFCPEGGFHIDPRRAVPTALITHGHSDHTRPGCGVYYTAKPGVSLVARRCGKPGSVRGVPYNQPMRLGKISVSFHPAGHILGSAQIRLESDKEVWVFSGDYNPSSTGHTAERFKPVPCDVFVTECTFAMPIYRWPAEAEVVEEIQQWWADCRTRGKTAVLSCYPLGKCQRLLALLGGGEEPIVTVGNGQIFHRLYREAGIHLPESPPLTELNASQFRSRALILCSSSAKPEVLRGLEPLSHGFASGWMQVRRFRRREDLDRGFVMSDHADWNGILQTIQATGANRIGLTHGQTDILQRYLRESGYQCFAT